MIKAILFDLGDVLIENSFDLVLKELSNHLGILVDELRYLERPYKKRLITGELSVYDFSKSIKDNFNLALSQDKIFSIWEKTYKKVRTINKPLYNFAKNLKKKYSIGLISNIFDLMAKVDRERGIFKIFDPCILSCEVGLAKPDKEIFELALKEMNLEGKECVFIDNRGCHLVEPEKLGFKTILFKNNEQAIKELKGLLSE